MTAAGRAANERCSNELFACIDLLQARPASATVIRPLCHRSYLIKRHVERKVCLPPDVARLTDARAEITNDRNLYFELLTFICSHMRLRKHSEDNGDSHNNCFARRHRLFVLAIRGGNGSLDHQSPGQRFSLGWVRSGRVVVHCIRPDVFGDKLCIKSDEHKYSRVGQLTYLDLFDPCCCLLGYIEHSLKLYNFSVINCYEFQQSRGSYSV